MVLDFQRALDHLENSLDGWLICDLRSKYERSYVLRIIKTFKEDNTGEVSGYSIRVVSVTHHWIGVERMIVIICFMWCMIHNDSDEKDMELWDVDQ